MSCNTVYILLKRTVHLVLAIAFVSRIFLSSLQNNSYRGYNLYTYFSLSFYMLYYEIAIKFTLV